MKLVNALLRHAWLALRLKHNGAGLPENIPAAFLLAALYIALSLANSHVSGDFNPHTMIGLSFIVQFYVFLLRDKVVGLILLIGIVMNAFALALSPFAGMQETKMVMLSLMEFVMLFGALINIILNLEHHRN